MISISQRRNWDVGLLVDAAALGRSGRRYEGLRFRQFFERMPFRFREEKESPLLSNALGEDSDVAICSIFRRTKRDFLYLAFHEYFSR
ncbi:hypothetical protein WDZ92_00205 [Nostoc sp. NIES-2111]